MILPPISIPYPRIIYAGHLFWFHNFHYKYFLIKLFSYNCILYCRGEQTCWGRGSTVARALDRTVICPRISHPNLDCKYWTWVEVSCSDKHSRLLLRNVNLWVSYRDVYKTSKAEFVKYIKWNSIYATINKICNIFCHFLPGCCTQS